MSGSIKVQKTWVIPPGASEFTIKMIELRDEYTGWQELHKKIINFRTKYQITAFQFLELCCLSFIREFEELCEDDGNKFHPSYESFDPALEILELDSSLFQNIDSGFLIVEEDKVNNVINIRESFQNEILSSIITHPQNNRNDQNEQ